jgi:hypothetical protein
MGLEQGDVCIYQVNYTQLDNNLKLWIDKSVDSDVTIVDGLSNHPYLLKKAEAFNY